MKYGSLIIILTMLFFNTSALTHVAAFSDTDHVPLSRQNRHDDIRRQQIDIDKLDGKEDGILWAGNNATINNQIGDALYRVPNELRQWVEGDDAEIPTNNDKVRYLRYISDVLSFYHAKYRSKEITGLELPALVNNAQLIMKARAAGQPIISYIQNSPYGAANIEALIFADTSDSKAIAAVIYGKFATLHPDQILKTIAPFADEPYADSLISLACRLDPVQFYSYAQSSGSTVGKLIARNGDNMVKLVSNLSHMDNALFYFPFLDDLQSGRQTIDDIKKYVGDGDKGYDSVGYYKLLVRTATAYSRRMAIPLKDTPVAYYGDNGLWKTLYKKAKTHFIDQINALHEQNNIAVRMKAIQPLSAGDLYYMMIVGENDIYTSSYKHSFNRFMSLLGSKPHGDSLLLSVNFDHFRKFIKMAANYNQLDTFLKTMPPDHAAFVMKAFVANLENNNLEDAVDVADAYSSITDDQLKQSMLANVITNEKQSVADNNRKGIVIYGLLKTIFLSSDDNSPTDLSAQIGIPSIYDVNNKYMQDDKGRIVEQVYFYGDKDGKTYFPQFRSTFAGKDWKLTDKKEWIEAVSTKGNIYVFANKPLDNDNNLDDTAQIHLGEYLQEQGMKPSVVVHRGHSYWLDHTMARMPGDAKIVVLGSCGGYQNLNEILEINPDAHIVSTKEIGTGDINRPILTYINDQFATGNDLSWRKMWATLTKNFSNDPKNIRDSWDDYIPPYKNLGAIFLKAYSKKMESE